MPPKSKPIARRLSTPKSVDEDKAVIDDETFFGSAPKKLPPPKTIKQGEQHLSNTQAQKRPPAPVPPANDSKYKSSGTGGNPTASSNLKLTDPPAAPSKSRVTRELDEKWTDMFATNKQENSAKEDLLAKLVADEQKERKLAAASRPPPAQGSLTRSTAATSKFSF